MLKLKRGVLLNVPEYVDEYLFPHLSSFKMMITYPSVLVSDKWERRIGYKLREDSRMWKKRYSGVVFKLIVNNDQRNYASVKKIN